MYREWPECLIIDATYKTNRYGMPLIDIMGVSTLSMSYYFGFAFIANEKDNDYLWLVKMLQRTFDELNLPYPQVICTDRELALIKAIGKVFPDTNHTLCVWHINKNVTAHCKKSFSSEEEWTEFYDYWRCVVMAPVKTEFTQFWTHLWQKYSPTHRECLEYLHREWWPWRHTFLAYKTNKFLHLGLTVTSRAEGGHSVLKKYLQVSTGDLKVVTDKIKLMITNQEIEIRAAVEKAQILRPYKLRGRELALVLNRIAPKTLDIVADQWKKMVEEREGPQTVCRNILNKTMGIPCSHKLAEILNTVRDQLNLDDFHVHWHLSRSNVPDDTSANHAPDPVSTIRSPRRNRIVSINTSRPQRSTQRDPSLFEIVEEQSRNLGSGRGRPHGRRRGNNRGRGQGSSASGRGSDATSGGNSRDVGGGEEIGLLVAGAVDTGRKGKGRPPGSRNKRGNRGAATRVYETRWGPRTDAPVDNESD